jgi:hypothetical protein
VGPHGASPEQLDRRRHHVASVADAFLGEAPGPPPVRPELVVAGPGLGVAAQVSSALAGRGSSVPLHDLGDAVGVHLGRWEREGPPYPAPEAPVVMVWCVRGAEALSLGCGLVLGRLAALFEPRVATIVWMPECGHGGVVPTEPARQRVRRLSSLAVPRGRVSLHCVGWRGDAAAELGSLVARFG